MLLILPGAHSIRFEGWQLSSPNAYNLPSTTSTV
jgi:hypothetical protein